MPSFLDAAVRRALAKQPDDRFPSAAAFAEALAKPLRGEAKSDPRSSKRMVSARAALYAAAATVVIGLVGGWVLARSSLLERWTSAASGAVSATSIAGRRIGSCDDREHVARGGRSRRSHTAHDRGEPSVDATLLA